MSVKAQRIAAGLVAVAIVLLGVLLWVRVNPEISVGAPTRAAALDRSTLAAVQDDFVAVAERVRPTVVSVRTSRVVNVPSEMPGFNFFFGPGAGPNEKQAERGLGSGVIVRPDGYIVTNNHVVQDADRIMVAFADDSLGSVEAKLVGADPETDLAVIKVDRKGLKAIGMGEMKDCRVGQWAIAIGSPFGLSQTMTVGIISALGRRIQAPNSEFSMENMIQTDAAINRGNSGGPLVDSAGRLIGINSMIYSQTGSSQGVGFAIPVDVVKYVYPQLIESGKIARGRLGILIQDVSPEMAEVFGTKQGAVVAQVVAGTPAEKAGLKPGDVIVAIQGHQVKDVAEVRDAISRAGPNRKISLRMLRDGKTRELTATTELKSAMSTAPPQLPETKMSARGRSEALGLQVQSLDEATARTLGISTDAGLLITGVDPGSAAAEAGLRQGQILQSVNLTPVPTLQDFLRATSKLGKGAKVVTYVLDPQSGANLYLAFTL